ncbi:17791_t:CDS:2, partial [Racocetra fulgida]
MGGGGQLNTEVASNANVALYTCFSVGGLFAGPVINKIGPSISLALGGLTYALYSGSLFYYNHLQESAFPIISGAILGLGAALLWTGQGAIMLSYPSEADKGRFIGLFWVIFNLGGVLGSIVPLGLNWNSTAGSVNDGTYIGFMVLMAFGSLLAMTLLPPNKVIRDDGQHVSIQKFPKWEEELVGIIILTVVLMATWIGGLFFQLTYKREDELVHMDLYDSGYATKIILYIAYGGAISWRIDAVGTSYIAQFIICWVLLAISIPFALLVVLRIKDTNCDSKNSEEKVDLTATK